jgi:hypothetical protein
MPNPYAPFMPYMPVPGSTECINGWRGLSPLALNPHFGTAPGYNPAVHGPVEWTHWADLVNIYGEDDAGFARSPWDNVGVQYGLEALKDGAIAPAELPDLNANAGSWKEAKDMVQEGCPYVSTNPAVCAVVGVDVWSARNMSLSPDGGATPAARREGDREAGYAAYRSGMVFRGKIDIPLIDWRHYLEHRLDMHDSHQSFASRQRMLSFDGDASNQVIWFTDARPGTPQFDQTPMALGVIDEWMANMAAHPEQGVAGNKPAAAVDSCFATNGSPIASGDDVWAGILDDRPAGRARASSRSTRPRGSWPAGPSRVASSSASCCPSSGRWRRACTGRGGRAGPRSTASSGLSGAGSATTRRAISPSRQSCVPAGSSLAKRGAGAAPRGAGSVHGWRTTPVRAISKGRAVAALVRSSA